MSYLFHGQRSNEEVVLFTKQHPLVLLHPFLISAGIWLLPLIFYTFSNSNSILSVVVVLCLLIGGINALLAWYSWNNSVLLLTSERVVFLYQKGITNREFIECNIPNIHQVSHYIKGFFRTIFNYGDIHIFISGSSNPVILPNIPDPYEIQQEILRSASGEGFVEGVE